MTLIEAPVVPVVSTLPEHRPRPIDRARYPEPGATDPLPLHQGYPGGPAGAVLASATVADDETRVDPRLRGQLQGLAAAIVDAVAGRRPPQQLIRWVDDRVLAELVLQARLVRLRGRAGGVRSMRLQRIEDRVEAAVRIGDEEHNEALALRFDRLGARWVCTVAEFGPPTGRAPEVTRSRVQPRRV